MVETDTRKEPDIQAALEAQLEKTVEQEEEPVEEMPYLPPITHLTDEQIDIFSYFVPVAGMEKQICAVMQGVRDRRTKGTSARGNILIVGEPGCGKTKLATNLIKTVRSLYPHKSSNTGKIDAESLNKKDVRSLFDKINGGFIIVENAGLITNEKKTEIADALDEDKNGILLILEDTEKGIRESMTGNASFAAKFTEKIRIPIFTNDELVTFAKTYADSNGFAIDEMGILALYNSLGDIRTGTKGTSLLEVCEILDDAMDKAEKGGLMRFRRKLDEDGNIILREKDFR